MKQNQWSRFDKVHEYCDICKNKDDCIEWCFGNYFEQSESKVIKQGLLQRFLNWLLPNRG